MRAVRYIRMHVKKIAAASVLAAGVLFLVREASITGSKLPIEISQKVRNLSAQETEWQVAITAAPGDVLEHFVLVRLSPNREEPVQNAAISSTIYVGGEYRQGRF